MTWIYRTALGQDHHRFVEATADSARAECKGTGGGARPLKLAGVAVPGPALEGNSDADVVLHAVCNALSGLSGLNFLGPRADALCRAGVTDSEFYVREALEDLHRLRPGGELVHLSVSIEALRPKLLEHIPRMKRNLGRILKLPPENIGLTATTGEKLTGMGEGKGIACLCILSFREPEKENTPPQ